MRNIIVLILCLFINNTAQTQNYWQQNADYKINVDVNANNNTYKVNQEIKYTNNSRDTLNKIFFHLYFNAFKVGSDMAVRLENGDDNNKRFDVNINKAFILILIYVVIFPAIAAYYCWQKAIELIGPNRSSMFIQLMPLFSALMAIIIFKEKFQLFHFIGASFIISGIYLSNRKTQ